MGKLSTREVTTTWHCDFCGFEEMYTESGNGHERHIDELPCNWMWVILGPNGEECRFGTTDKLNYTFIMHYAVAKSEFKRGIACFACAKNVTRKIAEREPAPPPPSRWRRMSVPAWLVYLLLLGNLLLGYFLMLKA